MKPLNKIETLASCLFDLSNCYKRQFGYDDFYLTIVNEGLKYHPNSVELTMQKANYYYINGLNAQKAGNKEVANKYYKQNLILIDRIDELG